MTAAADSTDHLAAADNTDSTDHLAAADNTDSTDHLAAADNTDSTDDSAAADNTDSTDHLAAADNTDSTDHSAAADNTDSTDHLAAADNTDSTDHLAAADNADNTGHLAAADNTDNTDNADRRLATGKRDRPRVGITVGDPAGIGPEIARKAAADPRVLEACEPILYGPPDGEPFELGRVSARAGRAAYDAIVSAVEDAMQGRIDAVATAPINKEAFAAAGVPWRGHTELLAHLTGARRVAMMFHADVLRVVLATVHIPLAEVPAALTRDVLEETIALAAGELPRFGLPSPRLAVAGLNPHAGEHGLMGFEEDAVMVPAIDACRAKGIRVEGPLPADTVFVRAMRGDFDAVIACYHDQGLIPVKLVAFGRAVNVTLGLPIIRTSVDHGTAFDIAGQGAADPSSLVHAVLLAAQLASTRA